MKRAFVAVLAIIGFVISGPAAMGQKSARDSLSADGPYILYRADGVEVGHIIVGHTVLEGVTAFHDGRVIGVNVDNSHNRKHHLTRALLIEEGRYYAVNDEGEKTLLITE